MMLDTFTKDFSQIATSQGYFYFPKWQLPKCANSQAETSQVVLAAVPCLKYKFFYKFDTVLYQFFETGTSDRTLIGLQKCLGFSLYPLSFFHYTPFKLLFMV